MAQMTLFELNNLIKSQLETQLQPSYWVIAEISELRLNQKGHCYMELVEKEHNLIQAKIRANIWSYTYRSLSSQFEIATGTALKPGIKVLFNLSINFHEVYGLSLTVNDIDPNYTLGERSKLREETIQKLIDESLTEKNKAIDLPIVPQKIAIISSDSAAGYGDFINQLSQNKDAYSFQTQLFPALMQGNEAVISMRKALKEIYESNQEFDAVVIIRGGGAQADLDCFDTYDLARAIALFPIPILTGIGHERDQTIADLVAHTSLKTPTAVAEFLLAGMARFDDILHEHLYRIEKECQAKLNVENQALQYTTNQLEQVTQNVFSANRHNLDQKTLTLKYSIEKAMKHESSQLESLQKQLTLVDPNTIFQRGYSMTLKNGKSVLNQSLKTGDLLETRTLNKSIKSKVTSIDNG